MRDGIPDKESLIYVIRGRPRNLETVDSQDIESLDNIEDAQKETYNLRIEHPAWIFWISKEENHVEIQKSFCLQPELSF